MRDNLVTHTFNASRVLITGGLGFIGSNLAYRLVKLGANVTVVDSLIPEHGGNEWNIQPFKDDIKVTIADIRNEDLMKKLVSGQEYLFNLAGQTSHLDSMHNPHEDLDINARAQLYILDACKEQNPEIKIVFASTRQVYGKPRYLPVDEQHPLQPVDINGVNKLAGEWYHLLYHKIYGIRSTVLRLTNTIGPRMRVKDARQTFLGIWIRRLIEDEPLLIYGDGMQLRDFNYVDDVVTALIKVALNDKAAGKIYNLGHTDITNLKSLAELMVDIHSSGKYQIIPFPEDRKAIDIGDYFADYSLIANELGWQPQTNLKESLRQTMDYFYENHGHYW